MKNRRMDSWDLPMEMPRSMYESDEYDPMGSYTGRPLEKWELPVQDADDL